MDLTSDGFARKPGSSDSWGRVFGLSGTLRVVFYANETCVAKLLDASSDVLLESGSAKASQWPWAVEELKELIIDQLGV